jgi:hypothetical protein
MAANDDDGHGQISNFKSASHRGVYILVFVEIRQALRRNCRLLLDPKKGACEDVDEHERNHEQSEDFEEGRAKAEDRIILECPGIMNTRLSVERRP